ncbi:HDOD domain-containing protein [Desulfolutivibrio sulfoxidireducens]|uniref:HDOD domain-containing protein n=1 Tax=Desulfolutivibrio sulfoxidireducens TaxID=2773299 RepID=UPI00159E679D|nr:HDOD domain-containing protein [Desulfolutivibrio sulfoxidireducens]QLA15352.1 HDOD domain-containing protein [Desulfolutivibrio sulfoxidireducens]QLA18931.1 HDOD domain-containing protein [Desulfolutivibrio sulfoxidireducens]
MNHERGQRFLLDLPSLRLDLPFSPILLEKLFTLTGEGSMAPPGDIADTLAKDQGLTAKILTMANSAFYGLQSEVRTVHRAVTVLGLNEIRTLVLALGVKHLAASHKLPPAFDVPAYFEHQLAVGLTAKELSPLLGVADADNLFTAGVLHDLGKLLTAQHRPDDWLAIESLCAAENILYHPAEERYWGLDHGLIGAMVLKSWNLPAELTEPVNWHHVPTHSPTHRREAITLCTADAMVRRLENPAIPCDAPWRRVLQKFDLDPEATLAAIQALLSARPLNLFALAA